MLSPQPRKILVVGATGGSGRAAVAALTAAGHHVTAFSRSAGTLHAEFADIATIEGDVMHLSLIHISEPTRPY